MKMRTQCPLSALEVRRCVCYFSSESLQTMAASRARGVVVSRLLCMQKASGSNPDESTFAVCRASLRTSKMILQPSVRMYRFLAILYHTRGISSDGRALA